MNEHKRKQNVVNVWLSIGGPAGRGRPCFGGDACGNCRLEGVDDGLDVRLKEAGIDLRENVADCFALVCELD